MEASRSFFSRPRRMTIFQQALITLFYLYLNILVVAYQSQYQVGICRHFSSRNSKGVVKKQNTAFFVQNPELEEQWSCLSSKLLGPRYQLISKGESCKVFDLNEPLLEEKPLQKQEGTNTKPFLNKSLLPQAYALSNTENTEQPKDNSLTVAFCILGAVPTSLVAYRQYRMSQPGNADSQKPFIDQKELFNQRIKMVQANPFEYLQERQQRDMEAFLQASGEREQQINKNIEVALQELKRKFDEEDNKARVKAGVSSAVIVGVKMDTEAESKKEDNAANKTVKDLIIKTAIEANEDTEKAALVRAKREAEVENKVLAAQTLSAKSSETKSKPWLLQVEGGLIKLKPFAKGFWSTSFSWMKPKAYKPAFSKKTVPTDSAVLEKAVNAPPVELENAAPASPVEREKWRVDVFNILSKLRPNIKSSTTATATVSEPTTNAKITTAPVAQIVSEPTSETSPVIAEKSTAISNLKSQAKAMQPTVVYGRPVLQRQVFRSKLVTPQEKSQAKAMQPTVVYGRPVLQRQVFRSKLITPQEKMGTDRQNVQSYHSSSTVLQPAIYRDTNFERRVRRDDRKNAIEEQIIRICSQVKGGLSKIQDAQVSEIKALVESLVAFAEPIEKTAYQYYDIHGRWSAIFNEKVLNQSKRPLRLVAMEQEINCVDGTVVEQNVRSIAGFKIRLLKEGDFNWDVSKITKMIGYGPTRKQQEIEDVLYLSKDLRIGKIERTGELVCYKRKEQMVAYKF